MTQSVSLAPAELVEQSATEMARRLAAGEIRSVDLVEAHIARIEQVNARLNAVVFPLFAQARREAAAADAAHDRGESLGPLHGVPITIKECFHIAGTPSTEGIVRFAHELLPTDAPLVARLRRAGAIVLGKTNVPQLMLLSETDNPVYGRTNNPWNLERSPGGSSGGESAIIAAGGSPLGLANDVGGSIRQPAHSCGLCGLKPTSLRLSNAGVRGNLHGLEAIRPCAGPIARRVEDLWLALQVLSTPDSDKIDAQTVPVALRNPAFVDVTQLRVGYWADDGYFSASPAVRRAVEEAAEALRAAGASVETFDPPEMTHAMDLYFGLVSADGAADAARLMDDGPAEKSIARLMQLCRMPAWLRKLSRMVASTFGQRRTADLLKSIGARSADEFWQLSAARAAYAERFFACWSARNFDILLCPVHALPALTHGSFEHLATAGSYGYWVNLLGAPAGVVPITRVAPGEESDRPESRDVVERAAASVERGSAGLPIGVQLVGRPWREDVVLAAMTALEAHFSAQPGFPHTPIR